MRAAILAVALALPLVAPMAARAGSTEPALAITMATAAVNDGTVTLVVLGNYDHQDVVRLGYPVTIVVTAGTTVARLGLDGTVTVAVGADPPAAVPGAPGVIGIAPDRLAAVLPPALVPAAAASVRLEADFDGTTLRSNAAQVTW
jgi:hypothetical protein